MDKLDRMETIRLQLQKLRTGKDVEMENKYENYVYDILNLLDFPFSPNITIDIVDDKPHYILTWADCFKNKLMIEVDINGYAYEYNSLMREKLKKYNIRYVEDKMSIYKDVKWFFENSKW